MQTYSITLRKLPGHTYEQSAPGGAEYLDNTEELPLGKQHLPLIMKPQCYESQQL
jgi:hypothetical protein